MDTLTPGERAAHRALASLPTRGPTLLVSERTYAEIIGALQDACNLLALYATPSGADTLRRCQRALCLAGSPLEDPKP